nr:Cof-type HAD-IIB family hydrolase [uncultured Oscillibacter sp.]
MSKVIFLDIDGTLVDYENRLPSSAAQAVRQARANGHRVYVCTGRSKAEVYPWLWDIGLDGMIGGNGSYVEDHGQVIFHQTLTPDQCRRVVDWLHSRGLEFYLESNSGLFASENFEEAALPAIRLYSKRKEREGAERVTVRSAFPEIIFGENLYRDDLNKVSFLLSDYQDYLDARDAFPDLKAGTWGGKGEEALFGDLGVKDIDKAAAVETLVRHLHGDMKDTIAFGDAKVDIPMLECCAYGVAMGNGGPEIKAMADYVADSVEQDGLYKAFQALGLLDGEE